MLIQCYESIKKILELLRTARVAELSERFCFDLSDALSGDVEHLSDFFESPHLAVLKSESELQHLLFPVRKSMQDFEKLFPEHRIRSRVRRRGGIVVGEEIAEMAVFLIPISAAISSAEAS